ncbi:MAG: nucleotide sugar dehydrogenase [Rhizobiales bacterium]|nr:nucleotide sugar dehydrogenase [Hyphomicrobiales bacterium]
MSHNRKIAVIGLGYVGLPVAVSFARSGASVIGFDINETRVEELKRGIDRTGEVETGNVLHESLTYCTDPTELKQADFFIITVPTPIDDARRPDLSALLAASKMVGKVLKPGDIVVYESTVYPGATEEDCVPVLEEASSLRGGQDFSVGYSPERINPGDKEHRFETIVKIVSGQNPETLAIISKVYGSVVTAGIFEASSIKTAEAAKVIENTQRDLNIALVNELALIFDRLDIDTHDVLEAAGTKWNFLRFTPGLVGGHCIGVDPYYLTHKSEQIGYHPQIILSGRRVNDGMGGWVAAQCVRMLMKRGAGSEPVVTILGLTFKEDVPDLRNSRVVDIVTELQHFGIEVQVHDPCVDVDEASDEYGITPVALDELKPADALILAVSHKQFKHAGWELMKKLLNQQQGSVLDLKNTLDRKSIPQGIDLWRL